MPRKTRPLASPEVAKIRERFHAAIQAGMSIAEASAYANGQEPAEPKLDFSKPEPASAAPPKAKHEPKKAKVESAPPIEPTWIDNGNQPSAFAETDEPKEAPAASPKVEVSAPAEKAPASETAAPAAKKKVEIPEKFDQLPWPKLRELCLKIGKPNIGSRVEAVSAIKAYVAE